MVERSVPVEDGPTTEELESVMPGFGNTVTVRELGTDVLDAVPLDGEHRAALVVVSGPSPGQVYLLKEESVIGRDPISGT